jgi:hypothetical protein
MPPPPAAAPAKTKVPRRKPSRDASDTKRVHVNFANRTYEALIRIADRKGGSLSEALRQAIMLTDFIEDAIEAGARIMVERGDGIPRELLIR